MNDSIVITFGVLGVGVLAFVREKFGDRGLILGAAAIGLIGVLALPHRSENVTLFGGVLCGVVVGLFTRRVLPLAGSIVAAVLLGGLGLIVAFMSIFRW